MAKQTQKMTRAEKTHQSEITQRILVRMEKRLMRSSKRRRRADMKKAYVSAAEAVANALRKL